MSDQVWVALIGACAVIGAAVIGAIVTMSGRGRDAAILEALRARDEENRRLADEIEHLHHERDEPDENPPRRRRHAP